jgi:Arc/MetJ-type ribon-helix-helix transcriptional regulator
MLFSEPTRTTQQFSITLPLDMAEAVGRQVKSGAYASVSEVVRDLFERDAAVERWLATRGRRAGRRGVYMHQAAAGRTQTRVTFRGGHLHAAR